jgi:hypothetical protein
MLPSSYGVSQPRFRFRRQEHDFQPAIEAPLTFSRAHATGERL